MPLKEKLSDIWDDICWYTTSYPQKIYRDVRHWWRCCGKYLDHWRFVWYAMFHCYPWDSSYMFNIERAWIRKSNSYFNSGKAWCGEEKIEEINKYQKICLGLLDTITDKREFWDYDLEAHKVVMKIPVNMRNKHRFPYRGVDANGKSCMSTDIYEMCPDEYYRMKAQYLYYKILNEYAGNWWD